MASLNQRGALPHTPALLLLLLGVGALAQTGPASLTSKMKADAEQRARDEVSDLLRTLCPEQCVLLSVEARIDEETTSEAPPGFEAVTPGARVPVLRALTASVLVDQELPSSFRTRAKALVSERLKNLGAQPSVNIQTVKFPPKNAPHLDAAEKKPEPAPDRKEEEPMQPQLSPWERLQERLVDSVPILALVVFAGLTLIILGVLMVLAVRRASAPPPAVEPGYGDYLPGEVVAQPVAAATAVASPAPLPELPPARLRKLERALREERTVRNAVIRDTLSKGEAALVARWTRELGDFLLEDIRPDTVSPEAIARLSAELVKPPTTDPALKAAALHDLEGRLIAARLVHASETAEAAFAFLQGVRPERFAAACQALAPAALEVALRFAPPRHRAAAMGRLTPAARQEMALAWVRRPDITASHAHAVADELKAHVAEASSRASELDEMVVEVVESLSPEEQEAFVKRLEREGDGRVARALVTEATLRETPLEVLSAALLNLPPARLVAYLSGAEPEIRDQLLAACPRGLQGELKEELGMRGQSAPEEFLAARREVMASLRDEMARRGLKVGNGVSGGGGAGGGARS
jgi:hypothetical protein